MTKHMITVRSLQSSTHLWCERDETGKIVKMTTAGGQELQFGYYGEWVKYQGKTWRFDKDSSYGEVIKK